MNIQDLEYYAPLRFKFASIGDDDLPRYDSNEEYRLIFPIDEVPLGDGWIASNQGVIQTEKKQFNKTWIISKNIFNNKINLVAQEHETGLEVLIPQPVIDLAVNVGVNIMTSLITSFGKNMWDKWKSSRKSNTGLITEKVEPSFIIESSTERFNDGRIKESKRFEYRGPLDGDSVAEQLSKALLEICNKNIKPE